MSERCALFIIIALGESVLVTGATFAGLAWTPATVAAFIVSFVGSVAMWWLYFDASAEFGTETIAGSRDPGSVARLSYTYVHPFLVAGIVLAAVADEFVLAHPAGTPSRKSRWRSWVGRRCISLESRCSNGRSREYSRRRIWSSSWGWR